MAERPVFISNRNENDYVKVKNIEFEWFPGFSVKQKQKSVESLHQNIRKRYPTLNVLEVSSKSNKELGVALSAFNLMIRTKNDKVFSVETAFQASKVFEFGGPFVDLYEKTSKDAKKDSRIKNSGKLLYFQFFSRRWGLEPKTMFYDWLYINALSKNNELSKQVIEFDAFTDIEFNPQKSINCQARSVALYVSLYRSNLLHNALLSVDNFKVIVFQKENKFEEERKVEEDLKIDQLSIFDETINEK
ncbi:DarT1-associated NADAR antitoxin family protein [Bacillus hominis]|uniref:DarT1-associated NADAR antitoxin family protein n=1 Tax=Bacillus hominis TaxID=2817478 RepID=UPI003D65A832